MSSRLLGLGGRRATIWLPVGVRLGRAGVREREVTILEDGKET
jgi:hypothetical protein